MKTMKHKTAERMMKVWTTDVDYKGPQWICKSELPLLLLLIREAKPGTVIEVEVEMLTEKEYRTAPKVDYWSFGEELGLGRDALRERRAPAIYRSQKKSKSVEG